MASSHLTTTAGSSAWPVLTSAFRSKAFFALAVGGFAIGLTEFVIMGILPQVAGALKVTIPQAGHFISAYALGVVVGGPIFTGLGGRRPAHGVLLALMLWFTVFNTLSAFAFNYHSLLLSRFLAGLPHGAYFGIGAVVAGRLAEPGRAAAAAAALFSGLTVANVLGVPAGTYLGQALGWQSSFVLAGLSGGAAVLALRRWMPPLPAASQAGFLKDLAIFGRLQFWLALLLTVIGTGGFFCWYSYIAPLLTEVGGYPSRMVVPMMALAGLGMTVGIGIGARIADRYSPLRASVGLLLLMAGSLLLLTQVAHFPLVLGLMTFWVGGVAFALVTPIQFTMIAASAGSEMMGSAINQSAFNLGNALGAYLGGLPIALGYGIVSADAVGALMALVGVGIAGLMLSLRRLPSPP
jgi:DHA1 family arabinose polymer transporter-like MFS transporter